MLSLTIFITSYLVVLFSIPSIIKVSFKKRLFDDPTEVRKVHKRIIPNLGGIAIFTAFLFSSSLIIPHQHLPEGSILMAAGLLLFMTGLRDDLVGLTPAFKFIAQIGSAIVVSIVANLRIDNLHGLFNYHELNYISSIALSVLFIVGIVNAYNLIDGIDGLAGSLTLIFSLTYAFLFFKAGELGWSLMALSMAGAILGFLFFNITPAKIFMGDCGSLLIGFLAAIFSIKFLSIETPVPMHLGAFPINEKMGLVLAILIIPIFDTVRVFTLRILRNRSPFTADSNHLHHRLLFLNLSHIQATFVLALTNVMFIILVLALQDFSAGEVISILGITILTINGLLSLHIEHYKKSLFAHTAPSAGLQEDRTPNEHYGSKVLNKIFKN